ncbi:MAG: hypothetical protein QW201_02220 [Thermoproteota archaeon]
MVSWGRAFKAALVLLAFMIIWGILGAIIIFAGSTTGVFGQAINITPHPPYFSVDWSSLISLIVFWTIGGLIIFLGTWASIFKVLTDLIVEDVKKVVSTTTSATTAIPPTPACPKCGTQLVYVQQYQRLYCPTCKEYQ